MVELKGSAERLLAEFGEFHPFGGVLERDGRIAITSYLAEQEFPLGRDVVRELASSLSERATRGDVRAVGIAADVRVSPPENASHEIDALRVSLDHEDGYSVHVFFPYTVADGTVAFDKAFATRGRSFAFSGEPFPG